MMYAGDEFYDDDVTSGLLDAPKVMCNCDVRADELPETRHDEKCRYRLVIEAIFREGYPA